MKGLLAGIETDQIHTGAHADLVKHHESRIRRFLEAARAEDLKDGNLVQRFLIRRSIEREMRRQLAECAPAEANY